MMRLAILIWVMAATVLAGCFVTVVILVPGLERQAMLYIPIAAAIAAIVAAPIAWLVARQILKSVRT